VVHRGLSVRQSNETSQNTVSSRSHAIFQVELLALNDHGVRTSQLNIVDLAGSERSKNQVADRLVEAGSINRSLMVLGQCIEVLRNQRKTGTVGGIIPFRQNKLTELLFGNVILKKADNRTVMIVNLSQTTPYEENVGVLRYASLAHEIEALPASELGGLSRSAGGEVRCDGCVSRGCADEDWAEKVAQMEFMLREEECKRVDAEQKYLLLYQEILQQGMEWDEKMAEMERTYMYRIIEQVASVMIELTLESRILRPRGCKVGYYGVVNAKDDHKGGPRAGPERSIDSGPRR
jgi:Kinesin motor domain